MKHLTFAALLGALLMTGCATSPTDATAAKPNGSRLWAQNCTRCHNSRSPSELSPAQWDPVVLHMRLRAGLTAADSRAILEFLQSSN